MAVNSIINGNGTVPYTPPSRGISVLGALKSYETYTEFILDSDKGAFAWCDDATADPTVNEGGALYRIKPDGSIMKILETESMDQIFSGDVPWVRIINKPESSVLDIDQAVNDMHTHKNLGLLELFTADKNGIKYNSYDVLTTDNMYTHVANLISEFEGQTNHVHPNTELLNSIQVKDGRIYVGEQTIVTTEDIKDLDVSLPPAVFEETVSGNVEMDLSTTNDFVFTGSSDFIQPAFTNYEEGSKGTLTVCSSTQVLWPKGEWVDGLTWVWTNYPEDISSVEGENMFFVLDFKIIKNYVFLTFNASSVTNVEE